MIGDEGRVQPEGPQAIIVGAGLMGRWHADAARRAGIRVRGIVDQDESRARRLAERIEGSRTARTIAAMAERGDVVHVCTPLSTHVDLATAAIDAGCHAIVEKPIAPRSEDVELLLVRAQAASRLLVPVHQYVFQRGVLQVLRRLPGLGAMLHLEAVACTAGAEGRTDAERDAVALEVLPHPLSIVARFIAPAVDSISWRARRTRAGELRVDATTAGTSLSMLVSTRGRPTQNTLRVICDRGTVHVDFFHGYATILRGSTSRAFKIVRPFAEAIRSLGAASSNLAVRAARGDVAYPGLRELIARTYEAVERPGDLWENSPLPAAETLAIARAWDTIAASMESDAATVRSGR